MMYKFLDSAFDSAQFHTSMIRRWWLRKDVSLRFKFLNFLSGDRLRIALVFHEMEVKGAWVNATEAYNRSDGNPDYYEWYAECAMHYAEQAAKSLEDIWKI